MFENSFSPPSQLLIMTGMVVFACLVGTFIPFYIEAMGDRIARVLAFPDRAEEPYD